ncbi:MAG: DUF1456 family protein [Methylobacter sp.]|nr:DUF1456 family protein [Methylobacter sp.]
MINNDVLRQVRYALELKDPTMLEIFALCDAEVSRDELLKLLKKDNEEDFVPLDNKLLGQFLDGLIIYKRCKQETPSTEPAKKPEPLTNNTILKKLSSFFRQKGHKHHRECGDQILRNFLQGLTVRFREQD